VTSDHPRRAALLPVGFFLRSTRRVARDLIGCIIESRMGRARTLGRIVEVEAYLGHRDPASHAYANRRHAQNETLYAPAGTWYVYRSYGVHWCANLVCEHRVKGGAVLLRAVEPLEGLVVMRRRRGGIERDRLLASGPGRLTQAFAIDRSLDGVVMSRSAVRIYQSGQEVEVSTSRRIGITRAVDWPLRFTLAASRYLSR
jgi:DNA-3-methyladenine glycosylase